MTAFEESWKFLKALPEQTMFLPPTAPRNLTENPEDYRFSSHSAVPLEHYEGYKADDRGNRAVGTVHPAIQSLLRRISTTDNVDEQGNRISNLNLNAYRDNDYNGNDEVYRDRGMIMGHPERNYIMSRRGEGQQ